MILAERLESKSFIASIHVACPEAEQEACKIGG